MRFKIIATFSLVFLIAFSFAQATVHDTGRVEFVQDYKIKELLNKSIEINSKTPIKGYRIKIHFGSNRDKANEIKAKFITLFPTIPAYIEWDSPNFNVPVGDFRTKLEAYKFLKEVQVKFPAAFLVQDEIELPELN